MSRSEKNSLCAGNASLWPSCWPQVEAFAGPAAVLLISLPRVARRSSPGCSSEPGLPFYPLLTAAPFHLLKCWNFWPIHVSFLSSSCFYPKACLVSIAAVLVHYSFVQFYISLTEPVSIPSSLSSFGRTKKPSKCSLQDKLLPWLWPCLLHLLRASREESPAPRQRQPRPSQPWSPAISRSRLCLPRLLALLHPHQRLLLHRRHQHPVMAPSTLRSCE